jgi:hypothetical protein
MGSPGLAVFTVAVSSGAPACTVITAFIVDVPLAFAAVSVYVVVAAGITVTDAPGAAVKPLIETLLASLTVHCNVADCPASIVAGIALKLSIKGFAAGAPPAPPPHPATRHKDASGARIPPGEQVFANRLLRVTHLSPALPDTTSSENNPR